MWEALDGGSLEVLAPFILGAGLVLLRLGACLAMVIELGQGIVPARSRVALALVLTVCLDLALGGVAVPIPASPAGILVMAAREVVLGAALGLAVRLVNAAAQMAGDLIGLSMGLSLSTLFDFTQGEMPLATGRLFSLVASLLFLALGGHLVVVASLYHHLHAYPVGVDLIDVPTLESLARAIGHSLETAVILAAPVLVVTLLLNVAMGFVMRLVPSVNLFNIGVGVLMVGGFVALALEGQALRVMMDREVERLPEAMHELAAPMPPPGLPGSPPGLPGPPTPAGP